MTDMPGGMPAPSRTLGRYDIIREIGRGGMATVYLARQTTLDRNVALKELSALHAGSPELAQRFVQESRLAGSLNHPNVVTVLEYFEDSGTPYIAMEYVPRGSLRPYVGRLDLAAFAGVMEGVLAGLAHAETFGIVHRDLKPENIMVTNEGRVKIADFGIAKATQATGSPGFKTATGMTVGTPAYMPPEQIMGHDIGIWTDLYSVGVMAYEHAVGELPFHDSTAPLAVLLRHVNEEIPPALQSNPEIDSDLSAWIERLLIKDWRLRTQSPAAAWEELEEVVLRLLGPRWRRDARLPEDASTLDPPRPLTPAPFDSCGLRAATVRQRRPAQPSKRDALPPLQEPSPPPAQTAQPREEPRRLREQPAVEPVNARHTETPREADADRRRMAPERSSRRLWIWGIGIASAIALAVAGFLLGDSGKSVRTKSTPTRTAAAGHVALAAPAAWITPTDTPQVPGLSLSRELAREDPSSGGILLAGVLPDAGGKLLLPPAFVSRVHRTLTPNDAVKLGSATAYRYRNLRVSGLHAPLTVLVSPATTGVIGIACLIPATDPANFAAACEQAAGTLRLSGADPLPLGHNAAYGKAVTATVAALRAAEATTRALARAKANTDQARLCLALSRTEASAASVIASAHPGPDAAAINAQLLTALRGAANGYRQMGKAARDSDRAAYNSARADTQRELTAARTALVSLRKLGYGS